jgi:hypothetical protein
MLTIFPDSMMHIRDCLSHRLCKPTGKCHGLGWVSEVWVMNLMIFVPSENLFPQHGSGFLQGKNMYYISLHYCEFVWNL